MDKNSIKPDLIAVKWILVWMSAKKSENSSA
jgi:hypothetical protein